jgi:hypothetical protein
MNKQLIFLQENSYQAVTPAKAGVQFIEHTGFRLSPE